MKFLRPLAGGGQEITVSWTDHAPGCERCRMVDLSRPATFAHTCASPGAALLQEKLRALQAPVDRQKRKENEEWAKRAGTFPTPRSGKVKTPYVGG